MTDLHGSRSDEQSRAESLIVAQVAERTGKAIGPGKVAIGDGATVHPDGVDGELSVFVEAYARQGKLAPGQLKKVAQDILKFSILRADHPDADLVLAFASAEAMNSIRGWLKVAADRHGIQLVHTPLPSDVADGIRKAQDRQREGMKLTAQTSPDALVDEADGAMT